MPHRAHSCVRLIAPLLAAAMCAFAVSAATAAPVVSNRSASVADLFHCLHGKTTLVSAHRGGPESGYPENAIETFAHTLSQIPAMLEVDVRTTSDGVIVLMHDETIDRTTDGHGAVKDMTWQALSEVHLRDNDGKVTTFHVPRLVDVLVWIKGRGLLALDMKEGADTQTVAAAIRAAKSESSVAVIAYSLEQAKTFYDADPDITIIYPTDTVADLDAVLKAGVPAARLMAWTGIQGQKRDIWRHAHDLGIPVIYGTLFFSDYAMKMTGNIEHYGYLAQSGVDLMPTDYPTIAFKVIDALRPAEKALRRCHAAGN